MVVGACQVELLLHGVDSLKGKRKILKSMIQRVRNKFNVAMAEVAENDITFRARVGFVTVGNDRRFVNAVIDNVCDFIEELHMAEVAGQEFDIVNY